MRKLESFHQEAMNSENESVVFGGRLESSSRCNYYDVTCDNGREDRSWSHYCDGDLIWSTCTYVDEEC